MPSAPTLRELEMIARRGLSALAWEVLRRQPGYREAYRRMASPEAGVGAGTAFTVDWGLHFR